MMDKYPFLTLIPPFVVICVGFIGKKLNLALSAGIFSAAIIATSGSFNQSLLLIKERLWDQISSINNLYLYFFLIIISCLVVFINKGPGPTAFVTIIRNKMRSAKSVELATIGCSIALSLDDYLSILTVGNVMKFANDQFGISRQKVAFFIHALAGSMVILLPISSWVATITGYLTQAGISPSGHKESLILADPFFIYLATIPFMFYSFFILLSTFIIILCDIPFLGTTIPQIASSFEKKSHAKFNDLFDLFMPLILLFMSVIGGILYTGNARIFGGNASLFDAFRNNDQIFFILFSASSITLLATIILGLKKQTVKLSFIPSYFYDGYAVMKDAIIMVILASTLGALLKIDLKTGNYLASLVLHAIPLSLIPLICFITSLLGTIATGSAWGTFSLMTAITIPMLVSMYQLSENASYADIPLLFSTLGSIFSGGICGDHISPFSETTIMAAASTNIDPLDHATSQFPYTIPAIIGTALAFLCTGLLSSSSIFMQTLISLSTGSIITIGLLLLLKRAKKQSKPDENI